MSKQIFGYTEPTMPEAGYVRYTAVSIEPQGAVVVAIRNQKGEHNEITLPEGEAEMMARAILDAIHTLGVAEAERADDAVTGLTVERAANIIAGHYGHEYVVTINSVSKPDLPVEVIAAEGFIRNHCEQEGFGAFICRRDRGCDVVTGQPETPIWANSGGGPGSGVT